jgi:hypothetical protein
MKLERFYSHDTCPWCFSCLEVLVLPSKIPTFHGTTRKSLFPSPSSVKIEDVPKALATTEEVSTSMALWGTMAAGMWFLGRCSSTKSSYVMLCNVM